MRCKICDYSEITRSGLLETYSKDNRINKEGICSDCYRDSNNKYTYDGSLSAQGLQLDEFMEGFEDIVDLEEVKEEQIATEEQLKKEEQSSLSSVHKQ